MHGENKDKKFDTTGKYLLEPNKKSVVELFCKNS